MNVQDYLTNKKEIQQKLIDLLKNDDEYSTSMTDFIKFLDDQQIREDENEFRAFLHLFLSISNNFHRFRGFFKKIEEILLIFKDELKKYFTNFEMFTFFNSNKKIILFLFNSGLIEFDDIILHNILKEEKMSFKYYLYPEIKNYIDESKQKEIETKLISEDSEFFDNFKEKQQKGENDSYICELIRNDYIDEFVGYTNKTNFKLSSEIKPSIFETNLFVINNKLTLIDYAAFYGSIQIFQYLKMNNATIKPLVWNCAIHSLNAEMFHLIEELRVDLPNNSFDNILISAIECHHNEMVDYLLENKYSCENEILIQESIRCYNYYYLPNEIDIKYFSLLCENDYYYIVTQMLSQKLIGYNANFGFRSSDLSYFTSSLNISIINNNYNLASFLFKSKYTDPNMDITFLNLPNKEIICNGIFFAITHNRIKILKLLLTNGKFDINCIRIIKNKLNNGSFNFVKDTAIRFAIKEENIEMVKLIISLPEFDINCGSNTINSSNLNDILYFSTPLHDAIFNENEKIIELLLSIKNININQKYINANTNDISKETPLFIAIKQQNIKIIRMLLIHSSINVNKKSFNKTGDNEYKETPLYQAIKKQNIEIVKILLEHPNIDINKKSVVSTITATSKSITKETVLHLAVKLQNKDILELLLKHPQINVNMRIVNKMNPNINNKKAKKIKSKNTGLNMAIFDGNNEIISLLLNSKNIDINSKGTCYIQQTKYEWTPLAISIYKNQKENIEYLINQKNIDVNSEIAISNDSIQEKMSPLYMAIDNGNEATVKLLIEHQKINLNFVSIRNNSTMSDIQKTPIIHFAFIKANYNIINWLLCNEKTDLNTKLIHVKSSDDNIKMNEETIFIQAIKYGNLDILHLLLSNPSFDIHQQGLETQLTNLEISGKIVHIIEMAIKEKKTEIIKFLFKYGDEHGLHCYVDQGFKELTDDDEIKRIIDDYIEKHSKKA